jgi:hypothetical protein
MGAVERSGSPRVTDCSNRFQDFEQCFFEDKCVWPPAALSTLILSTLVVDSQMRDERLTELAVGMHS